VIPSVLARASSSRKTCGVTRKFNWTLEAIGLCRRIPDSLAGSAASSHSTDRCAIARQMLAYLRLMKLKCLTEDGGSLKWLRQAVSANPEPANDRTTRETQSPEVSPQGCADPEGRAAYGSDHVSDDRDAKNIG